MNPYRLRPLHNPEGIDTAKIPRGFRLLYRDEWQAAEGLPLWFRHYPSTTIWVPRSHPDFRSRPPARWVSYITPVNPDRRGLPRLAFAAYIPCDKWRRHLPKICKF